MNIQSKYLQRLGLQADGDRSSPALLAELQTAHLIAVAFENLDVFHRRGVTTDVRRSLSKIVERGRGGWCFELNGAFGWLLTAIGFNVDYVSCRVFDGQQWGPPLDHCALVVHVDAAQRLFVDVGFGDCCMIPIPLVTGDHHGIPRPVRCRVDGDGFVVAECFPDGSWVDQLSGSFDPVPLEAFTSRSDFLQTEPGLSWTAKPFATRATAGDGSRITLRPGVLRRRRGGGQFADTSVDPDAWSALLAEHFGLDDVIGGSPT